jgi:hypothetical protein
LALGELTMKLFQVHSRFAGLIVPACLALCFSAAGCASAPPAPAPVAQAQPTTTVRIVPAQSEEVPATIRKVDDTYQFVVIDFSSRAMPPVGTRLAVYRDGKPVGEVRISEPTRAQFATADILTGDLQVGDEAR